MHRFLRSIGFSKIKKREELQALINEVVEKTILRPDKADEKKNNKKVQEYASARDIAADEEDHVYAELSLDFVHGAGICVRGEFEEDNSFLYEYYFPYLRGSHISSNEDITIERQAEKESYAGVCDDIKVGISLIFYLQNMIPYKRLKALNRLPIQGTSLILSALSVFAHGFDKAEHELRGSDARKHAPRRSIARQFRKNCEHHLSRFKLGFIAQFIFGSNDCRLQAF